MRTEHLDRRTLLRGALAVSAALALPGCAHGGAGDPTAPEAAGGGDGAIRSVVSRVARRNLREIADGDYPAARTPAAARAARTPRGIEWSYPWGVTLYGMLRAADAIGDEAVKRFVLDHHRVVGRYYRWLAGLADAIGDDPGAQELFQRSPLRGLLKLGSLDNTGAMGAAMLEVMLRYPSEGGPEQREVVERAAEWITRGQDRLPDGTLWRPRARAGPTVWSDDLYMSCSFLARWACLTGDRRHLDDAARQIVNVARRAQDADGVFFHGYFERERRASPVKWGRGNAWALVATVEVLSAMDRDPRGAAPLLDVLRRHVAGLERLQAPSGMWRQILDQPGMWEETSCTAAYAYAIARAVSRGFLDAAHLAVARRAFTALAARVTPDGEVNGTCQGTDMGRDAAYYAARGRPDNDAHGPGLVLLAGAELLAPA